MPRATAQARAHGARARSFEAPPVAEPLPPPVPASGPRPTSGVAVTSCILGVLGLLAFLPLVSGDLFFFPGIGVALAIAATVLGAIGLRQDPKQYRGRGYAIAGLTLGIVGIGLTVVALILVYLFLLACAAACGGSALASGRRPIRTRDVVRGMLAHHPECGHYRNDTFSIAGTALCVGCTTTFLAALGVLAILAASGLPSHGAPWILVGLFVGLAAFVPSLVGRTVSRAAKVVTKAVAGVGAALLIHGLSAPTLELSTRATIVALVGLVALLLAIPRAWRLRAECRRHHAATL
jgi:hypothetical protein